MTRTHVPVLAGELIDLLDPHPGETAIDCTFGDGGHARLIAGRIGPGGTLVCIDRDPAAEERFEAFSREVECETRFLRMDYADALELLAAEGLEADIVYLDLGVSSMQIDAWERGFSYSYDAPLDMRMDPGQELDARTGARLAPVSFHALGARRVKRFLVARARGCICPPDLPVCACGRTPEAELLTQRAVAPTAGEVADNPRAGSGRLRAARKLEDGRS